MRKSQRCRRLVFKSKVFKSSHYRDKFFAYDFQSLSYHYYFCIIGDVAAGCAEVNNRRRGFRLHAERVNVRHNIVTNLVFALFGNVVIDVVGILFHFGDLLVGDVEPQFFLALGKRNP